MQINIGNQSIGAVCSSAATIVPLNIREFKGRAR